jgi:hypothetical protein
MLILLTIFWLDIYDIGFWLHYRLQHSIDAIGTQNRINKAGI